MPRTEINDMWMRATSTAPATAHVQVLDVGGARDTSLSITLKSVEFNSHPATATLTGTVEVSDDAGNWYPLSTTTPDLTLQVSTTATPGPGRYAGKSDAKGLGTPKGWRWMRVVYELTVTAGTADVFVSAVLSLNL